MSGMGMGGALTDMNLPHSAEQSCLHREVPAHLSEDAREVSLKYVQTNPE
jgi:hypothetical protein